MSHIPLMRIVASLVFVLTLISCKKYETSESGKTDDRIATDTSSVKPVVDAKHVVNLETKTGKSVKIVTSKSENGLWQITIVPEGFEFGETQNLEDKDPLEKAFMADLDENGFEEFYLVTTSSGSGSYGNIFGFASNSDKSLTPIYVPEPSEKDYDDGGMLQGYMGHDSIYLDKGLLMRKYPVYLEGDPNCCPTGGFRILEYNLIAGEAGWILQIKAPKPSSHPLP